MKSSMTIGYCSRRGNLALVKTFVNRVEKRVEKEEGVRM